MKIKMTVGVAGARFSLSPGDETEQFTDEEAKRMIEAGFAVPVVTKKVERATKKSVKETR